MKTRARVLFGAAATLAAVASSFVMAPGANAAIATPPACATNVISPTHVDLAPALRNVVCR